VKLDLRVLPEMTEMWVPPGRTEIEAPREPMVQTGWMASTGLTGATAQMALMGATALMELRAATA
jgi:hypothetical protein